MHGWRGHGFVSMQSSWAKSQVQSLGQLQANCKPAGPVHGPSWGMPCLGMPEAVVVGFGRRPFILFFSPPT
jgi:hypothetical protein